MTGSDTTRGEQRGRDAEYGERRTNSLRGPERGKRKGRGTGGNETQRACVTTRDSRPSVTFTKLPDTGVSLYCDLSLWSCSVAPSVVQSQPLFLEFLVSWVTPVSTLGTVRVVPLLGPRYRISAHISSLTQ